MPVQTQYRRAVSRGNLQLLTVVLLSAAAVLTADALRVFWTQMPRRDFGAFYASGQAWNRGGPIYAAGRQDLPNLNPPGSVALLFGPLARLPLAVAGTLWQALGAAALLFAWWRIIREVPLPRPDALFAFSVLLATVAARYVWLEGQITWMLLVPATEAWIAYRRRALVSSGAWLGLIVAVKPFFAVSALALGIPVAVASAAVGGGLTVLGMLLTSAEPWRQWLALGPGISVTWPASASIWTLGTRLVGAAPLDVVTWTDLPAAVTVAAFVASAAGLVAAAITRNPDRRWTIAIALALLVSPLGWMYYLPLAAGALTSLWAANRWSRVMTVAVGLCCIPMNVLFWGIRYGWISGISIGATYTWAVALMLIASVAAEARHTTRAAAPIASTHN